MTTDARKCELNERITASLLSTSRLVGSIGELSERKPASRTHPDLDPEPP